MHPTCHKVGKCYWAWQCWILSFMWRCWSRYHSTRNFMCHFFQFGFIVLATKTLLQNHFTAVIFLQIWTTYRCQLLLLTTFWKFHSFSDVQSTTGPAHWYFELFLRFTTMHTSPHTPWFFLTTAEVVKITTKKIAKIHSRHPLAFSFSSPSPMESPSCALTQISRNTAFVANR